MVSDANTLRIHVHDDTRVLDGMHSLVELAKGLRPLEETLIAMCRQVAEIAKVDVVSVYLREQQPDGDVLVMRGNVGFPRDAVGRVRLRGDEGLTGVVAARRRPVTVSVAQEDDRYKHVDGIGEEQFAAYMGVPLLVADEVAGVLVMQRRTPNTFDESDVSLASSLTAPIILVIGRHSAPKLRGPNSFVGTSLVPGRAIGPAVVLPAPSATPASEAAALHALEFDLVVAAQRLGHAGPTVARAIENFGLVTVALREKVAAGAHGDVVSALHRAPYHGAPGIKDLTALLAERHREISDLWAFLVTDMQHHLWLCGAVLAVPVLGTFMALEAVARGAAAVVVANKAEPGACDVLAAAELPVITNVAELVISVRSGEILEVDADRGTVRVLDRSCAAMTP